MCIFIQFYISQITQDNNDSYTFSQEQYRDRLGIQILLLKNKSYFDKLDYRRKGCSPLYIEQRDTK